MISSRSLEKEARHWGEARLDGGVLLVGGKPFRTWMHHPRIAAWVNERVTGDAARTWLDLWSSWVPVEGRGLSLGAGTGWLETEILRRGGAASIRCVDLFAPAGHAGLEWVTADVNTLELPREAFDFVLFHHSLHHMVEIEAIVERVAASLRPGGRVVVHDYVGEDRERWSLRKIAYLEEIVNELGLARGLMAPPLIVPPSVIARHSPFEQVRSSRILPALNQRLRVLHQVSWGGVLHPLRRHLERVDLDTWGEEKWSALLEADSRALENGVLPCIAFTVHEKANRVHFSRDGKEVNPVRLPEVNRVHLPPGGAPTHSGALPEVGREVNPVHFAFDAVAEQVARERVPAGVRLREWVRFLAWKLATKVRR